LILKIKIQVPGFKEQNNSLTKNSHLSGFKPTELVTVILRLQANIFY